MELWRILYANGSNKMDARDYDLEPVRKQEQTKDSRTRMGETFYSWCRYKARKILERLS